MPFYTEHKINFHVFFVPIHICTSTDKFHILANIWQIKDVLYMIKDDLEKLNLILFSLA